ncbi:hypothetical protein ACJJIC_12160 [Microbulbifer sp. ANSA002]|uniref:hypothetical protein n=1 Tax=unclassified Microbulbifer TaxID=2619833 RepID=UPI0040418870
MTERYEIRTKRLLSLLRPGNTKEVSSGGQVATGYKPDCVYKEGNKLWVLELESSTSRKGFIGGYIKAQKYFQENYPYDGRLLFIINHKKRNLMPIYQQIKQYHEWLKENGISVMPTYLMYDEPLLELTKRDVSIFSEEFLKSAELVK